jgi:hypothetical protein
MSNLTDSNRRPAAATPVDAPPGAGATGIAPLPKKMPAREAPLTVGALWRFYAPLGVGQSLMTVSHAIINGSLNRTVHPEASLASYAIAMSLHMLSESPMVMLRQTGAALLRDRASWPAYVRVAAVACALNVIASLLIAWTPLGHGLFHHGLGAPETLLPAVIATFQFSAFVVIFSTIRCVLHSVLLVNKKTLWITAGMAARLTVMLVLAVVLAMTGWLQDGRRGALIFMAGMATEAFAAMFGFRKWFRALPERPQPSAEDPAPRPLTPVRVWAFYLPLVLAAMTGAFGPSIVNAGLARMNHPQTVIATFAQAGVVTNLILGTIFLSHQVSLFFAAPPGAPGARERNAKVTVFFVQLGLGASGVLGLLAWTPVGDLLLIRAFQTTPALLPAVKQVLHISMFLPIIAVWNEYRVGLLLAAGRSRVLTISKLSNIAALAAAVLVLSRFCPNLGAVAAPLASLCALGVEQTVLVRMTKRLRSRKSGAE